MKLQPSDRKDKKWKVIFPNGKTIDFGAKGMSDYTIHKDVMRKENYIKRHEKREKWDDIYTAGFWSRWLLWNKPSLEESIIDIEDRYNILIDY